MPGCLSYVVARDPRDSNALWVTEVWDSAASHKASLSLPRVREAIAKGRPLIASFGDSVESEPIGGHGLASDQAGSVIERMNPQGLSTPTGYSHVVSARGGKTIYIAGQVAFDAKGQLVGKGDLAAQTRQVFENLATALKAAGATFSNVVKTNYYMRDASQVATVREIRSKYFSSAELPASTLVEVSRLANPDFLIEIEVIAVA
jgi:reactive intermediate/imine deaminase